MDLSREEADHSSLFAMQLASVSVLPMVLKSAIELDLLELIKKAGPGAMVSPAELAAQLPTSNPEAPVMLDRILRLLASYSVLKCDEVMRLSSGCGAVVERRYGVAPVCEYLTENADGVSMAALLLLSQDKVFMQTGYHLKDAVLDGGIPFNKAFGMSAFEYHGTDPRFNKVFNQAMSNNSTIIMKKILEVYNGFECFKTVVDVGGGTGASLNMIISKYSTIKGINFDLPHVVQDAIAYPGVEHVGGDMFVSVPTGDAIFMKSICHNWSDEHCQKLLKNCYKALRANGMVILAESILPEEPNTSLATQNTVCADVMMLTFYPGGKERTENEFEAMAKKAGFKGFKKICSAFNSWIMELHK